MEYFTIETVLILVAAWFISSYVFNHLLISQEQRKERFIKKETLRYVKKIKRYMIAINKLIIKNPSAAEDIFYFKKEQFILTELMRLHIRFKFMKKNDYDSYKKLVLETIENDFNLLRRVK